MLFEGLGLRCYTSQAQGFRLLVCVMPFKPETSCIHFFDLHYHVSCMLSS